METSIYQERNASVSGPQEMNEPISPVRKDSVASADAAASAPPSDTDGSPMKIFSCNECNKEFTRKHNLDTHMLVHSANKPFMCVVCKSGFKRSHDLKRHQRMHTGERPHQCPSCEKTFARGDALLRHMKHGCNLVTSGPAAVALNASALDNARSLAQKPNMVVQQQSTEREQAAAPAQQNGVSTSHTPFKVDHWKPVVDNRPHPYDITNTQQAPIARTSSLAVPPSSTRPLQLQQEHQQQQRHASTPAIVASPYYHSTPAPQPQQRAQQPPVPSSPQQSQRPGVAPGSTTATAIHNQTQSNKVELLELKVKHLEKIIDNDQYKMRELETRLARLEGVLLKDNALQ